VTPGFEGAPSGLGPSVNSAADARATYSPAGRRYCLSIVVQGSILCRVLTSCFLVSNSPNLRHASIETICRQIGSRKLDSGW
jgi:hypothetical protein